jgi:hypothetical protein
MRKDSVLMAKSTAKAARRAGKTRKPAARTSRKAGRKTGASRTRAATAKKKTGKAAKRKAARPAARPAAKTAKRAAGSKRSAAAKRRPATKRTAAAKPATAKRPAPRPAPARTRSKAVPRRAPTLDRERRRVTEADLLPSPPSSLDLDRSASAARSGRAELNQRLHEHTSSSPALTGGDVDADWEAAESVGDEAPGGDNPTPDQDVVDEIGRALGVEYQDNEELKGGDEIVERDRHRWELDPASSDDYDERNK